MKFWRFSGRRMPTTPKSRKTMSPAVVTKQVARVRVAMEEPVLEDHLEVGVEPPDPDLVRVETHLP